MDEARLNEFMGKLVTDMGGAAILANIILGEELGLYKAMADGQWLSPAQLAERSGCNARLLREWLSAHAASGYMEHQDGNFRLPEDLGPGTHRVEVRLGRRRFAPVAIEVG